MVKASVCRPGFASLSAVFLCLSGGLVVFIPELAPLFAGIGALYVVCYVAALCSEIVRRFGRRKARNLFYVGRDRHGYEPVWLADENLNARKIMIATGHPAGREQLLGLAAFNALGQAGGLMYVTESGDASAYRQIVGLALAAGREDDVLLVNLVSAPDVGAPVTHTFNPFSSATADAIAQMIMSGVDQNMDTVSTSRAMLLLSGVTRALVWERDQGLIEVNVGTIKQAMRLSRLVEYVSTDRMPSVPTHIRAAILDYLSCLSGFMLEKGGRQANSTFEHHNHILTQLLPMLSVLSNVHGHVFLTPEVDVDMRDVVLNRRILVVMMPPVERSIGSQAAVARALEGALRSVANDMISGNTPGCWAATCDRDNAGVAPFTVVFERGDAEYARGCADIARQANLLNMQFVYGFGLSEQDSGPQLSGYFDGSRIIARSHRAARVEESGCCTVGDVSLAHLNRRLNETPGAYLPVLRQA